MDITSIATTLNQVDTLSKVGVKVLDNSMEANEQLGAGLIQMIDTAAIERSINPHIDGNIDISV